MPSPERTGGQVSRGRTKTVFATRRPPWWPAAGPGAALLGALSRHDLRQPFLRDGQLSRELVGRVEVARAELEQISIGIRLGVGLGWDLGERRALRRRSCQHLVLV